MNELIYVLVGLLAGGSIGWLWQRLKFKNSFDEKLNTLNQKFWDTEIELKSEKEKNIRLKEENSRLDRELRNERDKILELSNHKATLSSNLTHLKDKYAEQKSEIEHIQERFAAEFKNMANEILEEKSKRFTDQNKVNINEILKPLNEKIIQFEKRVEESNKESIARSSALKEQIGSLKELNIKITREAENLTKALKGDTKTQGSWGEYILESILSKSGLEKGREYFVQESITQDGKRYRPDVIVNLPDKKKIIIDSKVSLVSYEKFSNEENEEDKASHLKNHLLSIRKHVKDLGDKNYQKLYRIDGLDFILMFVPIEPAFTVAVQQDRELFNDAYAKNIVLVSPSTLIATLRTIANIWKQEYQNRNAMEIARQSGALYDKFKSFVDDLIRVGNYLKQTHGSYEAAMNKLTNGKDNLIRKAERLKELGAKSSKDMDPRLLERAAPEVKEQKSLFE